MKQATTKRIVSLILTLVFAFYLIPTQVYAVEAEDVPFSEEEVFAEEPTDWPTDEIPTEDEEPEREPEVAEEITNRRSEAQKDFRMDNGMNLAVCYPYSVHYRDNEAWEEIDNTLWLDEKDDSPAYRNTAGMWEVSLPAVLSAESGVALERNGHALQMHLVAEVTQGQITALNEAAAEVDKPLDPEMFQPQTAVLAKLSSGVQYADVFEDTDLRYDLISNRLKESITLHSPKDGLTAYQYLLETELELVLQEDGQILAYAEGEEEPVFYLPAPYLYDATYEFSEDIQIQLEKTENGYLLTYVLPQEWLADEARSYPVVLDPVIQPVSSTFTINDQTVAENRDMNYQWGYIAVGKILSPNSGRERIFIMFNNLPTLTSADVVVSSTMTFLTSTVNYGMAVEAHQVYDTWQSSTISWYHDNLPGWNTNVEDYAQVGSSGSYTWDVTNIAQQWYATGKNTGVMFKAPDAIENANVERYIQFYSGDYSPYVAPVLQIAYVNNCGLEGYWDYTSHSAGRAGTGYINDYTGNLVWILDGLGFAGNRMPVSIRHIYNANDKDNNSFGHGYGWRTNYNQLVYQWSTDSSYYVWEDEDGTRHYFKYKSSGTYEDENGSGLILTTNNGTNPYCIKDKKDNKSYFDASGRLVKISNDQATISSIQITYTSDTSKLISQITDGAGRKYQFQYSNSALTQIKFVGTGTSTISSMTFTQSSSNLTSVVFPDNKSVTFTYSTGNSHLLTSAKDVGNYKLAYTYTNTETGSNWANSPHRVAKVTEYNSSTEGGSLAMEYAHNQTTFTDHNGNREILQFNKWGSTVSVQDGLGRGQFFNYTGTDNLKNATQMIRASKLQNSVINRSRNSSFENSGYWVSNSGNASTGSWSYSTAQAYLGSRSLAVTRTADGGSYSVIPTTPALTTLLPGRTYTMSAYVKTTDMNNTGTGARLWLSLASSPSISVAASGVIKTTSGWTRLELTYTHPASASSVDSILHLESGTVGTAYFDCVQSEESTSASRYNLVDNGDFRCPGSTLDICDGWTESSTCTTTEKRMTLPTGESSAAAQMDNRVYAMTGDVSKAKSMYQDIQVSGASGNVYLLAGWAKGDSVPLTGSRRFALICRFNNTDGTTTDRTVSFNPDTDSSNCWQYAAARVVAAKAYSSIRIILVYDYNQNTVYFDGIQLYKERFGETYSYDSDGNLVSAVDLQGKTTSYEYTNNNLTQLSLPTGVVENYTYDSHHNVTKAVSSNGVTTELTYDTYGNNTQVTVKNGSTTSTVTATYTPANETCPGNQLCTVKNALGKITTYGYDADTGVLNWLQQPGEDDNTRTNYSYDNLYRTTGVSQDGASASYAYTNDLLTSLAAPSGTSYTLNYGSFDLPSSVKIGTRTLVSYTYTDNQNHNLLTQTYGNGDYVSYTYDTYRRPTKQTWSNGDTVSYVYGSDGALGRMTDSATGRTTKYYYDFQGLLKRTQETGTDYSNKVTWTYSSTNNLTQQKQVLDGSTYTTNYTYDTHNRLSAVTRGIVSSVYAYDTLSRLSKLTITRNDADMVTTDLTYKAGGNSCTTSGQIATWKNSRYNNLGDGSLVGTATYSYTYDDRGSITAISDGTNTTAYVYDAKGQLTRENNQAAGKTWVYTYDNGGNILSKTEYAYTTATNPSSPTSTKSYTYGDTSWKDLLTGYNGATLTYDTIGNLTSDGTWSYTWQHGRQLAGMSSGTKSLTFAYNADGRRISKTYVNGETTTEARYYYAGNQLSKMTRGDKTLVFTYDSLGPRSVVYNGTNYYYLRNAQGDVLGIVNAYGVVVASYTYDAWGNVLSVTGSMSGTLGTLNPLRYRGYVYDTETKLYYLNSRYYNPATGRFVNADIFVSTGQGTLGSNMYAYCGNNPVNMVDDGGNLANWIIGGFVGGLIGIVSSAIRGDDVFAGAVQGAIAGVIAGAAIDVALALVATGGAVGILAAGYYAYAGGYLGNMAGEEASSLITTHHLVEDVKGMRKRSHIAGIYNLVSFMNSQAISVRYTDAGTGNIGKETTMQYVRETMITKAKHIDVYGDSVSAINTYVFSHLATYYIMNMKA